ncbi:hypothetical protein ACMAUO_20505 [Gluconacetobacter sp. Hr-1-5]|uniref:hypothetical protein n=1 Tax=Gluconacetobacter sp. Hr-1-5 TaxID=3395370 RepID=UPI003B518BDC
MDIKKLTLGDFLCSGEQQDTAVHPDIFSFGAPGFKDLVGSEIIALKKGYAIHHLNTSHGDVALLHNNKLVGYYAGEVIAISEDYQGRGLSVPMILEAVKMRPSPQKRNLSPAGRAALTAAWKAAHNQTKNQWLKEHKMTQKHVMKTITRIVRAEFIPGSSIVSIFFRGIFQLVECFIALYVSMILFQQLVLTGLAHVTYIAYLLLAIIIMILIYALGQPRELPRDD